MHFTAFPFVSGIQRESRIVYTSNEIPLEVMTKGDGVMKSEMVIKSEVVTKGELVTKGKALTKGAFPLMSGNRDKCSIGKC